MDEPKDVMLTAAGLLATTKLDEQGRSLDIEIIKKIEKTHVNALTVALGYVEELLSLSLGSSFPDQRGRDMSV